MNINEEYEQHLKTLVKGAGIAFTGMIIAKMLAYVYRVVIARYYGPADYGLFSIGVAVFTIFSVIAMMGLNGAIVHYIAYFHSKKDENRIKGVIMFSFKLVLPVSVLLTVSLFLLSDLISGVFFSTPELAIVFRIFSLALPFYSLVLIGSVIFVGFQRIKYQVYSDSIVSNVLKIAFLIVFSVMGLGIAGIVSSWLAAVIAAGLLTVYYIYRVFPGMRGMKPVYLNREMFSYALPLLLSNIMLVVFSYTDIILLGYFPNVNMTGVGIYSAGVAIAQLLTIISVTLTALFMPVLTRLHASKQKESFNNVYKTVTRWAFFVNFPALLMMIFFSRQIINIFFGADFIPGNVALVVLGLGYLFFSISTIPFLLLNAIRRTKNVLYVTAITLLFSIVLSVLLIPIYGIEGAAASVAVSNVIRFFLLIAVSYYFVRVMPLDKKVLKSLVSGVLSLIVVNYMSRMIFAEFPIHVMVVLFVLFVGLYLLMLLIMRGFGREDMEILKYLESKLGIRIGFLRRIIKRFV
jgi:O-antigen/teichoic acid export membrane protein